MSLRTLVSSTGRLAPLPFGVAVVAIYLMSFGSQVLLSPPVTGRLGVWAFTLVQAGLIWVWVVLHSRRLHDCGRPTGLATGIALIYALEVVLLVILVWLILTAGFARPEDADQEVSIMKLFVFVYLLALLTGDPTLGGLSYWIAGIVALLFVPVVIALWFSLWAATRPRVPVPP
jgi:hypothetical protein